MRFINAVSSSEPEKNARKIARDGMLSFGIDYLDDAMLGILPNDLILIGAGSGAGKTQICTNIAAANIARNRRVHYIALEAEQFEIERRIKYQIFSKLYYTKRLQERNGPISFQKWVMGDYLDSTREIEEMTTEEFSRNYSNLFVLYKTGKFDVNDLIFHVVACASETDLIIVDHVHYFDYDDTKENQAIKEIAKTARSLTLEQSKPMILVSHLRKRDKYSDELCPGLEEFHGSSDLYKIATKAITIAPGEVVSGGNYATYFRIVKNRFDGGVTRYMGRAEYSHYKGSYERGYKVGRSNQKREDGFASLDLLLYPEWAKRGGEGSSDSIAPQRGTFLPPQNPRGQSSFAGINGFSKGK